ncbi:DUF6193 family natural product biosynthesis protein [Kitasatospora paranensis]|uniref:DUF6193 family natural product biosynthesis protein n=1 Tax=Kitasatospora paranensis TaxID=258053 RepID=A0ABW2FTT7_9ACTN
MISGRSDDGPWPPRLPELYPEVAEAGSPAVALQRACAGLGAVPEAEPGEMGPVVQPPGHGRYRVRVFHSSLVLAETDGVAEAVAVVMDHLPADLGPAIVGDARGPGLGLGPCAARPRS